MIALIAFLLLLAMLAIGARVRGVRLSFRLSRYPRFRLQSGVPMCSKPCQPATPSKSLQPADDVASHER